VIWALANPRPNHRTHGGLPGARRPHGAYDPTLAVSLRRDCRLSPATGARRARLVRALGLLPALAVAGLLNLVLVLRLWSAIMPGAIEPLAGRRAGALCSTSDPRASHHSSTYAGKDSLSRATKRRPP